MGRVEDVRRIERIDEPGTLTAGDHIGWAYDGPQEWRAALAAFLREGPGAENA